MSCLASIYNPGRAGLGSAASATLLKRPESASGTRDIARGSGRMAACALADSALADSVVACDPLRFAELRTTRAHARAEA